MLECRSFSTNLSISRFLNKGHLFIDPAVISGLFLRKRIRKCHRRPLRCTQLASTWRRRPERLRLFDKETNGRETGRQIRRERVVCCGFVPQQKVYAHSSYMSGRLVTMSWQANKRTGMQPAAKGCCVTTVTCDNSFKSLFKYPSIRFSYENRHFSSYTEHHSKWNWRF